MLDPWSRLLSRQVIWNEGTTVGDVPLAPDDPRARRLDGAVSGGGPLTGVLRAAGVRFVIDDPNGPGPSPASRLPGAVVLVGPARADRLPAAGLSQARRARCRPGLP